LKSRQFIVKLKHGAHTHSAALFREKLLSQYQQQILAYYKAAGMTAV